MIWGLMSTQALHVTARLSLIDAMRDGPKRPAELAVQCAVSEGALHRLLRFLTAIDVLTEDENGRFAPTATGELLRSDHPSSLRAVAVLLGSPFYWNAWGNLYEAVKTGRPAFDLVNGESFFDHLVRHDDDASIFNTAMSGFARIDVPAILDAYDFSSFERIVDVAGGHGSLLRAILERYPRARGVLCDLPSVLASAADIAESPVAARCEMIPVDFFESVPPDGDVYLLKRILHDWSDDEAVVILRNCRRALAPGGRVLVAEQVVKPSNQPDPAKWMDLNMLTLLTGRERTEAEFGELYARAGLRLTQVIPATRLSIIEGVAA